MVVLSIIFPFKIPDGDVWLYTEIVNVHIITIVMNLKFFIVILINFMTTKMRSIKWIEFTFLAELFANLAEVKNTNDLLPLYRYKDPFINPVVGLGGRAFIKKFITNDFGHFIT